ncbi:DUF3823 domain-containing protein [Chitinophaga barathri]|nr:DUF3823 domain-containing protein [Chitinophaga barathri]
MKKILYSLLCVAAIVSSGACKKDNYALPDATLEGSLNDGKGSMQLEQGGGSVRIKLDELSWSATPIPMFLNFRQDGSYINTKLFPGQYRVTPVEGPFYPIDSADIKIVDLRSGGSTRADFNVVPYVNVEWVTPPSVTADKKVTATFRFTRTTPPPGKTQPALLDYQMFISTTQYVGNNNWDNTVIGAAQAAPGKEATDVVIKSTAPMKYATTYYIRVGVRVNDSFKKYNYTTISTVTVAP